AWSQDSGLLANAGIAQGWATIERLSGSGAFGAYGVVNDNGTSDGSFLPAVSGSVPDGRLTVPVVVETAAFRSELVLTNRAATAATVSLSYVESLTPSAGTGGTVSVTLAAREQRILPEAVDFLRSGGAAIGA